MLGISLLLMCVSFLWAPIEVEVLQSVDWRVIVLLFCLMLVMENFKEANVFARGGEHLLGHVQDTRYLALLLVVCCFICSMLLTNDVALITFVPFTLLLWRGISSEKLLMDTIIFETAAANLGSQWTPIGNPQNLYLYYHFNLTLPTFLRHMLWPTLFSLALVVLSSQVLHKERLHNHLQETAHVQMRSALLWTCAFVLCILSVLRVIPYLYLLGGLVLLALLSNPSSMKNVDYGVLLTFICLFIFVHNLLTAEIVHRHVVPLLQKNIYLSSILTSQVVSNVPAAMLLAPLTDNWKSLLYGVNVGGMGTLIASMASIISYKLYAAQKPQYKKVYLCRFFVYNFALLLLLGIVCYFLLLL